MDTTRRLLPPQCEVVNRRPRTQRDAAHELGDAPRTHSRKKQAYVSASLYSLQGRLIPAWSQETRHVLTYWWSCLLSRANRDWCLAKLKKNIHSLSWYRKACQALNPWSRSWKLWLYSSPQPPRSGGCGLSEPPRNCQHRFSVLHYNTVSSSLEEYKAFKKPSGLRS